MALGPLVPQKGHLGNKIQNIHSCLELKGIDIKGQCEFSEQLSQKHLLGPQYIQGMRTRHRGRGRIVIWVGKLVVWKGRRRRRKTMKNNVTFSAGGSGPPMTPPGGVPHTGPLLRLISGFGKCPVAIRIKKYAFFAFLILCVFYVNRYSS